MAKPVSQGATSFHTIVHPSWLILAVPPVLLDDNQVPLVRMRLHAVDPPQQVVDAPTLKVSPSLEAPPGAKPPPAQSHRADVRQRPQVLLRRACLVLLVVERILLAPFSSSSSSSDICSSSASSLFAL